MKQDGVGQVLGAPGKTVILELEKEFGSNRPLWPGNIFSIGSDISQCYSNNCTIILRWRDSRFGLKCFHECS